MYVSEFEQLILESKHILSTSQHNINYMVQATSLVYCWNS